MKTTANSLTANFEVDLLRLPKYNTLRYVYPAAESTS